MNSRTRAGMLFAIAAYVAWGVFPAYWKLLISVPSHEILAHRVLWATIFLSFLARLKTGKTLKTCFKVARGHLRMLLASATLIALNWGAYITAVNSGHVIDASLGYFINPLVNVFLGWALLSERLSRKQWASVALAAIGVLSMAFQGDHFPTISLFLAGTFGMYGLIRKQMKLEPLVASTVETTLLLPVALAYLIWLFPGRGVTLGHPPSIWLWLAIGGAVTALPLLWFAEAAQRLKLSTLGFFQYIAPSLQFALGIYYGEPFNSARARGFACIWVALAIFCFDLASSRKRALVPAA